MSTTDPFWKRALRALKSQWLATALIIPMILLGINAHLTNEAAKEARLQSARVERVVRLQDSGKALDVALAGYFTSVSEAGLAERGIRVPGTYRTLPLEQAQTALVQSRITAREALVRHASDVQALRGTIDQAEAEKYMVALANMSAAVERDGDVLAAGQNITVLSNLVVARNSLVDEAMDGLS